MFAITSPLGFNFGVNNCIFQTVLGLQVQKEIPKVITFLAYTLSLEHLKKKQLLRSKRRPGGQKKGAWLRAKLKT